MFDHTPDLNIRSPAEVSEALAQLRLFAEAGYALFPLGVRSKAPQHYRWQTRGYRDFDFGHWLAIGGNIGIRLGTTDLVIDVDPRNFADGDDPLARLREAVGADLADAPTTITGSGGRHLFFGLPADTRVLGRLAGYEGIDLKASGGLVVAPGSIHPDTGRPYRLDPERPPPAFTDRAPAALLDLIRRPDRGARAGGGGEITPEQLAVLLDALDPADFGRGKYVAWIALAAACHDATNGDGLDVWLAWCARDPTYGADAAASVIAHWQSFEAGRPNGATFRTLLAAVSAAGRQDLVARLGAEEDAVPDYAITYELGEQRSLEPDNTEESTDV